LSFGALDHGGVGQFFLGGEAHAGSASTAVGQSGAHIIVDALGVEGSLGLDLLGLLLEGPLRNLNGVDAQIVDHTAAQIAFPIKDSIPLVQNLNFDSKVPSLYLLQAIHMGQWEAEVDLHILNLAKLSAGDELLDVLVGGEESRPHGLHEEALVGLGSGQDALHLLLVHGQRLLAQNVLAIGQHQHSHLVVLGIQDTNVDHIWGKRRGEINLKCFYFSPGPYIQILCSVIEYFGI